MATLDDFMPSVVTQDTKKRQNIYSELVRHLQDPNSSLYSEELDKFVDGLAGWVTSSNYKISLNGIEILTLLVNRMGEGFKPYVTSVLPAVSDRLGDSKDPVREAAQELLLKLMVPGSSPQYVFERITGTFTHKLWRVREEILICLQSTLNHYGAKSLSLSKLINPICKLLEDQNSQVREAAINTLVEIYRHVGERVRQDLAKKDIAQSRMNVIFARMDEMRMTGNMVATADAPRGQDEPDFARPIGVPKSSKRVSSTASVGRRSNISSRATSAASTGSIKRKRSIKTGSSGAVDEDSFLRSFEDVPNLNIFSAKDVADNMHRIKEMLSDSNHPWEKRTDALKEIRSLVIAGAQDHDDFLQLLRQLEPCLILSAKDLRSQVVREACVTIAYLSQQLKGKFDHFAEAVLATLISLIPNSAKIMASSGKVCIVFIFQHTPAPRLIPIITGHLTSKSSVIRRDCCEFLDQLLHTWPTHTLERHIAILQEAIKKGIGDADSEARAHARKAFWGFATHFKEQADSLLNSLEPTKQKQLQGAMSSSSSNNSLNSASSLTSGRAGKGGRVRSVSIERSHDLAHTSDESLFLSELLSDISSWSSVGARRVAVSKTQSPRVDRTDGAENNGLVRSSSAVDLAGGSGRRPSSSRLPQNSYNSLRQSNESLDDDHGSRIPRPSFAHDLDSRQKKMHSESTAHSILSPDRSRPRSKIGASQSQPGSRSSSPSSRTNYLSHVTPGSSRVRRKSGIPRSQGASRESSPNRTGTYGRERKMSGGSNLMSRQAHRMPHSRGGTAQRVLGIGQDSEMAVANALRLNPRGLRRYEYDSDDAASETSSVCSERSYSSYVSRTSETSDSGERKLRLGKDVQEIVASLASGSWSDRKDGLQALQNLMRGDRELNRAEIKKITEIFTRMFHDPHSKVFTMFIETLTEFIYVYKLDLQDWLYILLTRLLNKMGAEMLGSVYMKVQRCLETVRDSFAYDHQFSILTRYIIDQTQTPNLKVKVKVALLNFLHGLTLVMDPGDFGNTSDTRLAVSRIITWTTEPKSADVRKAAQAVLISLFNLNSPEFSMMLSALPKTFQDGATKILHNHMRSSSQDAEPLTPRNVATPPSHRMRPSPNRSLHDEMETENMNPLDIYNSIKKTSADIQNWSKLDGHYDELKKERDSTSQDSGIQSSMPDVRGESPETRGDQIKRKLNYNPAHYQEEAMHEHKNGYNRAALEEAVFDVDNELLPEEMPTDGTDVMSGILKELSNHNERNEERKNAMLQLIKLTREGNGEVWEEHFKTTLLLLLETLVGDNDGHVRALSLRVLREILRHQPHRFQEYTELTIFKVLEAHKDSVKEVVRAAEECAATLASSLPADQCCRVLNNIILTEEFPVNQAAIKMETKVIEGASKEVVAELVPDMVTGLIKGYDNGESSVRKASVFCLVALYMVMGEDLRPYLKDLNGSKMKLLNLYIKRAMSQKEEGSEGSKGSQELI